MHAGWRGKCMRHRSGHSIKLVAKVIAARQKWPNEYGENTATIGSSFVQCFRAARQKSRTMRTKGSNSAGNGVRTGATDTSADRLQGAQSRPNANILDSTSTIVSIVAHPHSRIFANKTITKCWRICSQVWVAFVLVLMYRNLRKIFFTELKPNQVFVFWAQLPPPINGMYHLIRKIKSTPSLEPRSHETTKRLKVHRSHRVTIIPTKMRE